MTAKHEQPEWMMWLYRRGAVALVAAAAAVVLLAAGIAYWLDQRLVDLEERIAQQPPKSYVAPDLEALAADVDEAAIVRSRVVYAPVYSHVYYGGGRPFSLEATLSIRNISELGPVYIRSVRYFNTDGELVSSPVDRLIRLAPLQTIELVVDELDSSGGSGANFLVDWLVTNDVPAPLVEVAMVGTAGTQGVSFLTSGVDVP